MLDFATTAFVSILFLVDPPGTVPAFIALTSRYSPAKRRKTALVASVATTAILMGFAAVGNVIFQVLRLTLPAFQIAGGVILFITALRMIHADQDDEKEDDLKDAEAELPASEIAITPLAIPYLAGPAAMSDATPAATAAAA